jgi:hypothetical protein
MLRKVQSMNKESSQSYTDQNIVSKIIPCHDFGQYLLVFCSIDKNYLGMDTQPKRSQNPSFAILTLSDVFLSQGMFKF